MQRFTEQDWAAARGTEREAEMCEQLAAERFAQLKAAVLAGFADERIAEMASDYAFWAKDGRTARRNLAKVKP